MSTQTLPSPESARSRFVWTRYHVFLAILALAGLQLLFTLHLRMNALPAAEPAPEKMEAYNPELFKVMSFGQTPAVIDWMWIKTLEDPLITHVKKGSHPQIYYSLDLITSLDPAFLEAYTEGAILVSVIRDDGPGALHLLLKGEDFRKARLLEEPESFRKRYWKREWQVPFLLAYSYLFDMDDMPHAAEAYREAAGMPGAPYYLADLVHKLATREGQYEVGLRLIQFMSTVTRDPGVKRRLLERKAALSVSYYVFLLNQKLAAYLGSRIPPKERLADPAFRERIWAKFQKATGTPPIDPWGGRLSLGENCRIVTTTPHRKVFGLQ